MFITKDVEHAVLYADGRIFIPGIGAGEEPGLQLQDPHPDRDEHFGLIVPGDLCINMRQDLSGSAPFPRPLFVNISHSGGLRSSQAAADIVNGMNISSSTGAGCS